jgi:hypothetical protein
MNEKILKYVAQGISAVLHPFGIPTIGFLLVLGQLPEAEYYTMKLKIVLIGVIVVSSCLIPLFYYFLSSLNHQLFHEKKVVNSKLLLYIFVGISAFLGAQFLGKLPVTGIFRVIMLGVSLVSTLVFLISIRWKISAFTSATGGLWGMLVALNFRYGMDIVGLLIVVSFVSGIVISSRIFLDLNTPAENYSGFIMGAVAMFAMLLVV